MSDLGDRACDLECIKKTNRHEFVGPVKIVLIEPLPEDYQRKAWGSAFLSFALFLMGATVFTVFFYTLTFRLKSAENFHVFVCTMGVFLPAGIMMVSTLFGGSVHLRPLDRKCQHLLLQLFGIGCGVSGSLYVVFFGKAKNIITAHAVSGFLAGGLMICASIIGPIVLVSDQTKACGRFNKTVHVIFAVPCLLASTVSFILGLTKPSFKEWQPIPNLHYILIIFCITYTLLILMSMHLKSKLTTQ